MTFALGRPLLQCCAIHKTFGAFRVLRTEGKHCTARGLNGLTGTNFHAKAVLPMRHNAPCGPSHLQGGVLLHAPEQDTFSHHLNACG